MNKVTIQIEAILPLASDQLLLQCAAKYGAEVYPSECRGSYIVVGVKAAQTLEEYKAAVQELQSSYLEQVLQLCKRRGLFLPAIEKALGEAPKVLLQSSS